MGWQGPNQINIVHGGLVSSALQSRNRFFLQTPHSSREKAKSVSYGMHEKTINHYKQHDSDWFLVEPKSFSKISRKHLTANTVATGLLRMLAP